ncbi:site-specific integrase [Roseateles saccharophilus]|uniref:Uncharacterized protein n=1 Tax=Roseateles saccharophilus TaxID=304 RepID=A0A4R3UL49_ROSSA|nr:site-specific integrase [Roseateles saccharophilus]MDG0836093.1 site-specific integrase [Roseateles saccharophilus]TCU90654.1 hypothetical protein EV671_10302 [Roseateles saccharophilus]
MAQGPLRKARKSKSKAGLAAGPALPIDGASLAARKLARATLDLDSISMSFVVSAGGRSWSRDYSHHPPERNLLIRQLLAGAELALKGRATSFTVVQDFYYGIDEFIEFAFSGRYTSTSIRSFADIGVQTAKDLDAWYLSVYPGRTVNRKRYGKIRSIVSKLKKDFGALPDVGPDFKWPTGPKHNDRPVESYRAELFNSLVSASLADIRYVMAEWNRLEKSWDSIPVVAFPEQSIPDVCLVLRHLEEARVERGKSPEFLSIRRNRIAKNAMVQRVAARSNLTIQQFVDLYLASGEELSRSGVPFPTYRVNLDRCFSGIGFQESWDISTRTTAEFYPEWPLGVDVPDADFMMSLERFNRTREGNSRAEISNYRVLQSMRYGEIDRPFEVGIDAFFARTFFTGATLYPFYLYVQLNTGWNEEVVGSLSRNLERHIETDIIDPEYVLIWGWKGKVGAPASHRSSRTAPFSVYNILKFVSMVLEGQHDPNQKLSDDLWQYVLSKNLWMKFDRCVGLIGSGMSAPLSAAFIKRHSIELGTSFVKQQRVDARRLRTTCETRRRESGLSIDEVCTLMGHAQIDTTDASYDSDGAAIELKNKRIRGLQEEFVDDFRDYRARLMTSVTLQELRSAIQLAADARRVTPAAGAGAEAGLADREIVHLLSPKGQTYIAACVDRNSPSWPNAEQFVPPGASCSFFNRCCLCDKAVIFEEALPFVARRVMDLERLKLQLTIGDWTRNYGQEAHAWQAILDDWNDRDAVQHAQRQCLKLEFSLPLTMRGAQ